MSELLNKVKEDSTSFTNFYLLLQYVTSACAEKMRNRFIDEALSSPFFNALTKVDVSTFAFPANLPCKASDSARDKSFSRSSSLRKITRISGSRLRLLLMESLSKLTLKALK